MDPDSDNEDVAKRKCRSLIKSSATSSTTTVDNNHLLEQEGNVTNVIAFLIESLQPVAYISDPAFRRYSYRLNGKFIFPSVDSIEAGLTFEYEMMRSKIEDELTKVQFVSVSTECWQSYMSDMFVTIRVHYIDNDWQPHTHVLATRRLQSHTNIVEQMNVCIDEVAQLWNIRDKITLVSYDTAEIGNKPNRHVRIVCVAKVLNCSITAAINSLPEAKSLIDKCCKLVDHFHDDRLADVFLAKYQKSIDTPNVTLPRFNPNTFNAFYPFLKTIKEQKHTICAVLMDGGVMKRSTAKAIALNELDWNHISQMVDMLNPFELAKSIIFKENDIEGLVSVTKPVIHTLCKNFLMPKKDEEDQLVMQIKQSIQNELNISYKMYYDASDKDIEDPDSYDIAMYLDPRYKSLSCMNDRHRKNVWHYVSKQIVRSRSADAATSNGCSEGQSPAAAASSSSENGHSNTQTQRRPTAVDILFGSGIENEIGIECFNYNMESEIDKNLAPYDWWKLREHKYPSLAIEAKWYLCGRATCKPTYADDRFYARRATLSPQHVDQFLFLYNNSDKWNR